MQKSSGGQGGLLRDRVQREVIPLTVVKYFVGMISQFFGKAFNKIFMTFEYHSPVDQRLSMIYAFKTILQ
jgi:hypothetical protein